MRDTVRSWFFPELCDTAAAAAWLGDQAARGRWLTAWGSTVRFARRPPGAARYHLEPVRLPDLTPPEELRAGFAAGGWTYVCTAGELFHIFVSTQTHPAEPHTDPLAQAWAFGKLERRARSRALLACALWLAYAVYLFRDLDGFLRSLPELDWPRLALLFLVMPLLLLSYLGTLTVHWRRLRRARRRLERGLPLPRRKNWRRRLFLSRLSLGLVAASLVFVFTLEAAGPDSPTWINAPPGAPFPAPMLAELPGASPGARVAYAREAASPLAPALRMVRQEVAGGRELLHCYYADFRLRPAAALYYGAQLRYRRSGDALLFFGVEPTLAETPVPGWDRAAVGVGGDGGQYFLGLRQGTAVLFYYEGGNDLSAWVPALTAAVDAYQAESPA